MSSINAAPQEVTRRSRGDRFSLPAPQAAGIGIHRGSEGQGETRSHSVHFN